jgi:hypothetical protein
LLAFFKALFGIIAHASNVQLFGLTKFILEVLNLAFKLRKTLIALEEVLNLNTVIYQFFSEQFSVLKVFIKHFLH